jgi:hypothetical protein
MNFKASFVFDMEEINSIKFKTSNSGIFFISIYIDEKISQID